MQRFDIDPKAAGGTLGAILAGALWFFLSKAGVWDIDTWTADDLATAVGFTTAIFTAVGAYLPRNAGSVERAARRK